MKNKIKVLRSPNYNYIFNKETGEFWRWGKTKEDDPIYSPFGPEILDIELSTICNGINGKPCRWCYKSNTGKGENMSFETFKRIFHKMPKTLTQTAVGIGDIDGNPDLWKIMEYCRNNDYNYVVPNITVNGWNLTDKYADKLVNLCGAVSVSRYNDKNICYDAVEKLGKKGLKQVNIHQILSNETLDRCFDFIKDLKEDSRLKYLNAIIFLTIKPKGDRNNLNILKKFNKYKRLFEQLLENNIPFGTDSCGAPPLLRHLYDKNILSNYKESIEPCESFGLFSSYINVKGDYFPCSFAEGEGEWKKGISVLECENFVKDVWFSDKLNKWRKISLEISKKCNCEINNLCRPCPLFEIHPCKEILNEM